MAKVVTDYLDETVERYPDKIAFVDERKSISYKELYQESLKLAGCIASFGLKKKPIAIFMDKSIECIVSFLGVAYSGNFYTLIDMEMPLARIEKILDILKPELFITECSHMDEMTKIGINKDILCYEKAIEGHPDNSETDFRINRGDILNTDVLYVLFTSGSTGIPKGVVTPHRAIIQYIDALSEAYGINENTVMGNQVPFYFVMSIVDIYATIKAGGTMHIIPKSHFIFPGLLINDITQNNINFISWVPSALCSISSLKAFKQVDFPCLKTVVFGGEVMPVKQLNRWMKRFPDITFINGYGPTEVTDGCTYYVVNREFGENESIPIGKPFSNSEILVLDENNRLINKYEEIGELCVRSESLTYGYYHDSEKTKEVFVQNPLNDVYEEKIYRTGDLVRYNQLGELVYVGRKDFQIKHMGRRIELGEIEANISSIHGVNECCCFYDDKNKQIFMTYSGEIEDKEIKEKIEEILPVYMRPGKRIKIEVLPKNGNGKIDRARLKNIYLEGGMIR